MEINPHPLKNLSITLPPSEKSLLPPTPPPPSEGHQYSPFQQSDNNSATDLFPCRLVHSRVAS